MNLATQLLRHHVVIVANIALDLVGMDVTRPRFGEQFVVLLLSTPYLREAIKAGVVGRT